MTKTSRAVRDANSFQPSWVSPPGETIAELLKEVQMPVPAFAKAIEEENQFVLELLEGRRSITISLARKLADTLGASAQFWMNRDYLYRNGAERLQSENADWLKSLPIGDMVRFGWLNPAPRATEEVSAALKFFGVPSVGAWHKQYKPVENLTAFRTSNTYESEPHSVTAWLREGERRAERMPCANWNPDRFINVLDDVRQLTRIGDPRRFLPRLVEICASAGVAVVPLRAPNKCRASGAARFLSRNKALMLLSFRYLTDDHFWYTFFHESGHLLLHDDSLLFVDGLDETDGSNSINDSDPSPDLFSLQECEADEHAIRNLIPVTYQNEFERLKPNSKSVLRFAQKIGVSPGIIVGQLQHIGRLRPNQLNSLKRRYQWSDDSSTVVPKDR